MKRWTVALTGASGSAYGKRLVEVVSRMPFEVHLTASAAASKVFAHELGLELDLDAGEAIKIALAGRRTDNIVYHHYKNLEVPVASGSFKTEGMVIVPCSMGTVGRIASGSSTNLIERAADVCLKERRRLILVPRETPYSEIHLENMLRLTRAGATILPASPGLYAGARTVDDLIDFVTGRILDHMGLDHDLMKRYGEAADAAAAPEFEGWES